jgi:uncharacterized protein (TIGR02453 family)
MLMNDNLKKNDMNFKELLVFLSDMTENNNRDWFNNNKDKFLLLKAGFEKFIQSLIPEIYKIDPSIGPLEAKDCIFRIYRDVRFSKNKDPYKNHFGANISKGGRKSKNAGYYIHLQAGQSFLAAGAYMPEPEALKDIRYEIFEKNEKFRSIIDNKQFKNYFPKLEGEKLKTIPKGFPKEFEDIEFLKLKSFEIIHQISDNLLLSDDFDKYLLKVIEVAHPYNNFMNHIMDGIN